jgi:hypothetical protein
MPQELKSNFTQYNETEFNYMGLDILQPPGLGTIVEDSYKKLTDKIYLTLKHLYNTTKYNDHDWYLKADDDTFIFVDNLREFVAQKSPRAPQTFGYDFKVIVDNGYHSGGGGYLLSHESFSRLGAQLFNNYTVCPNTGTEGKFLRTFNCSIVKFFNTYIF